MFIFWLKKNKKSAAEELQNLKSGGIVDDSICSNKYKVNVSSAKFKQVFFKPFKFTIRIAFF